MGEQWWHALRVALAHGARRAHHPRTRVEGMVPNVAGSAACRGAMIAATCGHRDLSACGRGVLVREVGVMGETRAEEVRVAAARVVARVAPRRRRRVRRRR